MINRPLFFLRHWGQFDTEKITISTRFYGLADRNDGTLSRSGRCWNVFIDADFVIIEVTYDWRRQSTLWINRDRVGPVNSRRRLSIGRLIPRPRLAKGGSKTRKWRTCFIGFDQLPKAFAAKGLLEPICDIGHRLLLPCELPSPAGPDTKICEYPRISMGTVL